MLSRSLVAISLIALASDARGAALERRAAACSVYTDAIAAGSAQATATQFCNSYLGIYTRTRTATSTTATVTVTVSKGIYSTATNIVTPDAITKTSTSTQTMRVTTTPSTVTRTQTNTQTAYLMDDGSTIVQMKRDLPPHNTGLAKRAAVPTPQVFLGLPRATMTAVCKCLSIATPTATKIVRVKATATFTKTLVRTKSVATTLPTVVSSTTKVVSKTVNFAAAAPLQTATVLEVVPSYSCPPTMPAIYQCPEGTGDNESTDSQAIACGVDSADGYQGFCQYWTDDGSPAGSQLVFGDGTGESDNDITRDATYGDSPSDDCPTYADYMCNNAGARSRLVRMAMLRARATTGRKVPKKTAAQKAAHKKAGKKAVPFPPPRRGGRLRGFVNPAALPRSTVSAISTISKPLATASK